MANHRLNWLYAGLILLLAVFIARLFYLQIVRHDYYQKQALADQLKEYTIAPERGLIKAYENGIAVPLVLNQKLYTLYADPSLVKDAPATARKVAAISGGNADEYTKAMQKKGSRYVVLAKRLSEDQKAKLGKLKLAGVGVQAVDYRTYPQGPLASQLLGFVDNDGVGRYGLEQAMNKTLSGTPGRLKAITDVSGVPLAASKDNIKIDPKNGDDLTLTIDLGMQKELEDLLRAGLERAISTSGCALIVDPNTGAIKAMANWPSYDPSQYFNVKDISVFNNSCVSSPYEVGSVMKTLTTSAALDQGVITPNSTFNDPGYWKLDGSIVKNVEEDPPGPHSVPEILNLSINTGATWMLMQMGGGQINQQARDRWHDYMVNHFRLGRPTGIEQGYEAGGYVPNPDQGYGLNLTYANTTFGQAVTITPLQLATAVSAIVNGGTYYQPTLISATADHNSGQMAAHSPKVERTNVVSSQVSAELQSLMEYVVVGHLKEGFSYLNFPSNYIVGGKTGTAQIANPSGGYYDDRYNGSYVGFVGGAKPQYVIVVRVNEPKIGGYAGSTAAQPLFADIAHTLINNFNVQAKP